MFEKKQYRIIFLFFIAVSLVAYISGLFIDVTRDAGKYATVAKEIYQSGDFINLTIHGEPYDQKPPMLFWLGAAGFYIGGVSNFWFKFPVLIIVLLGFYSTYRLGKTLYNKKVGHIAATLLFFSFIFSLYSMDIHTDTPLQAFVVFSLWQLFEFIKTRKEHHWILGFAGIGLAMLSKGPIGAAIPAFAVIGHILMKKDFRLLFNFRWFLGILLALVVTSPALIGLYRQFGWDGIEFFFWKNNVGRITGNYVQASVHDPIFYFHTIAYLFLPWAVLFYIASFFEFKTLIRNKFRADEYFTLFGIWIFFIILNFSRSQLPNYIFILVPLISVLTAKWVEIAIIAQGKIFRIFSLTQIFVAVFFWIVFFAIVFYLFPSPGWYFWLVFAFAAIASIYILKTSGKELARILLPSAIIFSCLHLLINIHAIPYMFSFQAPPQAARYFNANANKGDVLYNYNYGQYELFFYSQPEALQLKNKGDLAEVAGVPGHWIFTDSAGYPDLKELSFTPDTVIEYQHVGLNRAIKFIIPSKRDKAFETFYLIKY